MNTTVNQSLLYAHNKYKLQDLIEHPDKYSIPNMELSLRSQILKYELGVPYLTSQQIKQLQDLCDPTRFKKY
jgi:hypothetical protein